MGPQPGGAAIRNPLRAARAPQGGAGGNGRNGGNGGGLQLGDQLQHRVQSGAITQQQAQRTAQQRQTLEKAFGPNWRQRVFGVNVGNLRSGLAGGKKGNPRYQAAYKAALERRKQMLAAARQKLAGGQE